MSAYDAFLFPEPEFYKPELTSSLDDGLDRWDGYAIADFGLTPLLSTVTPGRFGTSRVSRTAAAYIHPDWSHSLFGHILIRPARLDLGNLLTGQFVDLEVANLFLTPQQWDTLTTTVNGLTFLNDPFLTTGSLTIQSFGSYTLQVAISADGPPTVFGGIDFGFTAEGINVPVTGVRSILFAYEPLTPIRETIEWDTDILTAHDGTEQRISIRDVPRQRFVLEVIPTPELDRHIQSLLFDWLPRPFVVPIWWEWRPLETAALPGDPSLNVDTGAGDFRVGGALLLYTDQNNYESLTIDAINVGSFDLVTAVAGSYPAGAKVMPMRSAYAKTVPQSARIPNVYTRHAVEFQVIVNEPQPSTAGATLYGTKVLLDDCNLSISGESDAWSRQVVVLDNTSGNVLQTSHIERSTYLTSKVWDITSQAELWRVRQLLHAFGGSRTSFFLPSFRADFILTETITAGSLTFRVEERGYTAFIQSRRGMGDVRLVRYDGTAVTRRIMGSTIDGGSVEVMTIDETFDALNTIEPDDVERIEVVYMVRISDDTAEFEHGRRGDARISINVKSVKE